MILYAFLIGLALFGGGLLLDRRNYGAGHRIGPLGLGICICALVLGTLRLILLG